MLNYSNIEIQRNIVNELIEKILEPLIAIYSELLCEFLWTIKKWINHKKLENSIIKIWLWKAKTIVRNQDSKLMILID
ncbi:hypothetical protein HYD46_02905 [Mycoplasmopsis bovis]|nr:hypothetical protein [Mycoplasmopsis bovis]QQH78252.1 hypothetical protein HYD46_02905 [Mycoplasmopsis bovis]